MLTGLLVGLLLVSRPRVGEGRLAVGGARVVGGDGRFLVSVDDWVGTPVVGLTVVGALVETWGCWRIGAEEREVKGEGPKILGGREASGRVMQGGAGAWPGSTHSWGFATPQSVRSWLSPRLMAAP